MIVAKRSYEFFHEISSQSSRLLFCTRIVFFFFLEILCLVVRLLGQRVWTFPQFKKLKMSFRN